jgi:hypothetical protein
MLLIFALGYVGIVLEETIALNKSGVALLMASALWSIRACCTTGVSPSNVLSNSSSQFRPIPHDLTNPLSIPLRSLRSRQR